MLLHEWVKLFLSKKHHSDDLVRGQLDSDVECQWCSKWIKKKKIDSVVEVEAMNWN